MNKLLQRQINKYLSDSSDLPSEVWQLLQEISSTYDHSERDRKMLERSIELTSEELIGLNAQLQAEASELRKSEVHLSQSQHVANVGSWEYDFVADIIYWSDETYRIFGYAPRSVEVSMDLFYSHVHPADVENMKQRVQEAVDKKNLFSVVHRLVSGKTVHERAEVIFDENDLPLKAIGTVQDITERVQAEEALRKVHEEQQALFRNMNEMFFSVDLKTYQLIQMSDACEAIYGRKAKEFRQNSNLWYDLSHPDDRKLIDANYAKMNAGQSFSHEYRILHTDGTWRWVETRMTSTRDENGKPVRLDGITADITQRKEAEIALRNNEYKFRSLIENSVDAIMIINEKSEIIFASDSFQRVMGYTPEEVLGTPSLGQVYKEDIPKLLTHLDLVLKMPAEPSSVIYRRVKKDGTVIWCEGVATNLLHKPEVAGIVVNFRDITERVNTDEALRDSEYKFHSLIQHSADVITVLDSQSNIIFTSNSITRLTGFTPEETVGTNTTELIHPDDVALLDQKFAEALTGPGRTVSAVYRRRKKDGSYMWCEGTAINLLDDPAIKGVVVNFRDITERNNYEQALSQSERRLRALIENSSEAIIVADEQLNISYVSDSLYRVAGYRPADIIGLPILSLAHPDEKDMIIAFMEEVMQHPGVPKKLLYKTRRKDGSYIWCERVTINLLGDPAIAGIVSNFRDITERIEAERTIKDSEYKFRSLIQNSSDAITIADENGMRVFASDSLKKLTGYTPAEIIGEPIFSMVHPDYRDAAATFTSRVHASPGVPLKFVYKAMKKDGTPIWCERITTNLLHDPAISGIISNIRDITDRQEKEEELTLSNEELKTRNEELDKFVYSVSHDLRAPLTSILGLVEISGYCETVEDITGNLDMMKSSVHKLDSFIQDILNYSKNARTEVAKERIDFDDLLNGIADNLRFINAGNSSVRIETRYENGFDFYSDSHRINVILNNLLSNAIKYANPEAADPFVSVSAKLHANYAEVHIEDNGIGIKEEYQGKVFDMFFRATVSAPGSGLGLYIVREMLKKLNGTITFTSVEGKGTKFSLTIPNSAPESSNDPGVQCTVNLAHEAV